MTLIAIKTSPQEDFDDHGFLDLIESDVELQQELRQIYDRGFAAIGPGAILIDCPEDEYQYSSAKVVLAYIRNDANRQTSGQLLEQCDPQTQVVVMLLTGGRTPDRPRQMLLLNIPREVES